LNDKELGMLEYRFVRVAAVHDPRRSATALVEEQVQSLAADGWRLVQVLVEQPAAMANDYVLIMEREKAA
jgi:hypothetical protein